MPLHRWIKINTKKNKNSNLFSFESLFLSIKIFEINLKRNKCRIDYLKRNRSALDGLVECALNHLQ